jgi:predicted SAM-dependent methyltransferase
MSSPIEVRFSAQLSYEAAQQPLLDAEREHAATTRVVAELTQAVYSLAGELKGFGPAAHTLLGHAQPSLKARIAALLKSIETIHEDLAAVRGGFLWKQLQALGIDEHVRDLKLHIGCGGHHLKDWINLDNHPAPLTTNLDWGLPLPTGSTRFVFLSHLLEHLFYPAQSHRLLDEIHRVLMPGGVVRIVVPDIEQCLRAYADGDESFFRDRRHHWSWLPEDATPLESFLAYAGAGPTPEYLFEHHKFGYDFETLKRCLERAGFVRVRRCDYQSSLHPELRVDNASSNAQAESEGKHFSLFVEAERK